MLYMITNNTDWHHGRAISSDIVPIRFSKMISVSVGGTRVDRGVVAPESIPLLYNCIYLKQAGNCSTSLANKKSLRARLRTVNSYS